VPLWVVLVVVLQVTVPLVALVRPDHPNRFGFQMFTAQGHSVDVRAVDDEGRPIVLPPTARDLRPEADWTRILPARLCAALPEAHTVTVRQGAREVTVQCPQ